jgi:hypothetical protein
LRKQKKDGKKNYDGNVKRNRFREIAPDAKCTIKLSKLPLAAFLRNSPILILSKLVQFRSGHVLVVAWIQRMGIQSAEHHRICRELELIPHITSAFVPFERILHTSRETLVPLMRKRFFLETIKLFAAVAKLLTEDSMRSQAIGTGDSEPQSMSFDGGLSV